ncbi:MAG: hypothetical protein L6Q92_14800 [Phycisphaerae bacterium]|nr:hypothetical protein [Phycisphaerae bacterium]
MSERAVLVGIDEAGYGPVLGPLVVSAVAFDVPASLVDASLWTVLRNCVTTSPRPRDRRLPIIDSKKLYQRKDGLAQLERSALALVGARLDVPATARELLRRIAPAVLPTLDAYPWYRSADPRLPLESDSGGTRVAGATLARDAEACDVHVAGVFCEPLPEAHYNRLVGNTRNKAVVLFGLTTRLVQRVAEALPGRPIRFVADKQGARGHYGRMLLRSFEDRRLVIVEESEESSVYELHGSGASWTLRFCVQGEAKHLPVAAASILSKYVRELFMSMFNDWWAAHAPGVAATAGYYQDGMRFVNDVRPLLPRLGVRLEQLVRQR